MNCSAAPTAFVGCCPVCKAITKPHATLSAPAVTRTSLANASGLCAQMISSLRLRRDLEVIRAERRRRQPFAVEQVAYRMVRPPVAHGDRVVHLAAAYDDGVADDFRKRRAEHFVLAA